MSSIENAKIALFSIMIILSVFTFSATGVSVHSFTEESTQASDSVALVPNVDFNGDGFSDLAIGVPTEDIGSINSAGAVNVLYGSAGSGVNSTNDQFLNQNSAGVIDTAEQGDNFGRALASGDFNNDGFADLAIGVSGEDLGINEDAGAVNVLYGSLTGLTTADDQFWHQNSAGVLDTGEAGDEFGFSLTTGDFNNDGFADLVISTYDESVGNTSKAGAVNVLYGSSSGLTATDDDFWHQNSLGILDSSEANDNFGRSLATGDFNNDGSADLAIGVLYEDIQGVVDAGAVNILYGSSSGLTSSGNQFWHQNSPEVLDKAETGDDFGDAVSAGDFNNDGFVDLAIGAFYQDVAGSTLAGGVQILYGSSSGLTATDNQFWTQDSTDILDIPEEKDRFGRALATGDFNNDGFADLAIGVPYEDVGSTSFAGAVNVIYGSSSGLISTGNQFFSQDTSGIADSSETNDCFGWSLSAGDYNNDGFADLAIGETDEDIGSISDAGGVNVIYGSSSGLSSIGNQFWNQNSPGVLDSSETGDQFGRALTSDAEGGGTVATAGNAKSRILQEPVAAFLC